MDRVEEIEAAIAGLPPEEYRQLVDWIRAREETRWDQQMDRDSASGKLDFLFQEAEDESARAAPRVAAAVNSVATRRFWVSFTRFRLMFSNSPSRIIVYGARTRIIHRFTSAGCRAAWTGSVFASGTTIALSHINGGYAYMGLDRHTCRIRSAHEPLSWATALTLGETAAAFEEIELCTAPSNKALGRRGRLGAYRRLARLPFIL